MTEISKLNEPIHRELPFGGRQHEDLAEWTLEGKPKAIIAIRGDGAVLR